MHTSPSAPETRVVVVGSTELRCMARHPAGTKHHRFAERLHLARIGPCLPFHVKPTGRILKREEDVEVGMIGAYCTDCRLVTEYEIVAPREMSA